MPTVKLDQTHDPSLRSWIASANRLDAEFPIQNLPFGVFRRPGEAARGGVAIGEYIVDLTAVTDTRLLVGSVADVARAASGPSLEPLFRLGRRAARDLRVALSKLLRRGGRNVHARSDVSWLVPQSEVTLELPLAPRSFTDFCASSHHFRRMTAGQAGHPAFPLLPVAYNGRASTVRTSGFPVPRPSGLSGDSRQCGLAAETMLDFELELGVWLVGDSALAESLPPTAAEERVFGYGLVNDWTARGIQISELAHGPLLGKSFLTTVSPWIVTVDALAPFRVPGPARDADDPPCPTHLRTADDSGGIAVAVEAKLHTRLARQRELPPETVTRSNTRHLYWTVSQLIAHQTSNGANLATGDLIATGTVSGPEDSARACLAELTAMGREPLTLEHGEQRTFLEDGDEVSLVGRAARASFVSIGFGPCDGVITPARAAL